MPVLAIDQGTTSTRALRVADDGSAEIVASRKHTQHYPQTGWVEHDADELIDSILACVDAAGAIDAIGIDNQGESCLAWNADTLEPVSPVIVWQDNRTQKVIEHLKNEGHEKRILELSGLPLDSYFSASKLAWILKHNDEARRLQRQGRLRLGTTDAYFLHRLTGQCVTDITTASRTSLLNLQSGSWDEELCALFEVPLDVLPAVVPTTGDFGRIRGRRGEVPVTASVVDQQASLYGHGCREPGDVKITFGTGAFALMVTGNTPLRSPEQGLLPTVAWQLQQQGPVYAIDGGVYCAGSAVEWARKLQLFESYDEIGSYEREAAIERDLAFVPALSGLACPHWDRRAAGLWLGMSLDTDRSDLMQALLEGVAMRAAEVVRAMGAFVEVGDRISIDGGLSVNPYFCQFLADVLERRIAVKSMAELTALGTARLAGGSASAEDGEEKIYRPLKKRGTALQRYADAISRCREWR